MIKKYMICLVALCALFTLTRCNDDEVAAPPRATFTVDKTSGLANETVFTFTVEEVNADNVTLFPYGRDKAGFGTVPLSFTDGQAVVEFTYAQVGEFEAVVVSNNHNDDGTSIENVVSEARTITISSGKNAITSFELVYRVVDERGIYSDFKSTDVTIGDDEIEVVMPYGVDESRLFANFSSSPFSTVQIDGVEQESGVTVNDFTDDVQYKVIADDGTEHTYTVSVTEKAPEQWIGITPSASIVADEGSGIEERGIQAYVDSVSGVIVFYDVLGTSVDDFEKIEVTYGTASSFAEVSIDQETVFENIRDTDQTIVVTPQDPAVAAKTYSLYAVEAPRLNEIRLTNLEPDAIATPNGFNFVIPVLSQTPNDGHTAEFTVTLPASLTQDEVTAVEINGVPASLSFVSGGGDDPVVLEGSGTAHFTGGATFDIVVEDDDLGITYKIRYNAVLNKL